MSDPSRVRVSGPLLEYVPGFAGVLVRDGYASGSATGQLQLMARLSEWLGAQGLGAADLTATRVNEFVAWRRSQGYRQRRSSHALEPLLGYLQALGVAPALTVQVKTPSEVLLERYRRHLVQARGLAPKTVQRYVTWAAVGLLAGLADGGGEVDLDRLTAGFVVETRAPKHRDHGVAWRGRAHYSVHRRMRCPRRWRDSDSASGGRQAIARLPVRRLE